MPLTFIGSGRAFLRHFQWRAASTPIITTPARSVYLAAYNNNNHIANLTRVGTGFEKRINFAATRNATTSTKKTTGTKKKTDKTTQKKKRELTPEQKEKQKEKAKKEEIKVLKKSILEPPKKLPVNVYILAVQDAISTLKDKYSLPRDAFKAATQEASKLSSYDQQVG